MNCKEGDLAIIVKSKAGNEGKIVRCIKYVGKLDEHLEGDCWLIDTFLNAVFAVSNTPSKPRPYVSDSNLRPIRDQTSEDETLTWAGKPNAKHKKTSCK